MDDADQELKGSAPAIGDPPPRSPSLGITDLTINLTMMLAVSTKNLTRSGDNNDYFWVLPRNSIN